jgi:NhaP-type Na+/H+ and K+/H+ antiporter
MKLIEDTCKVAREARQRLEERALVLQDLIAEAQRSMLPGIRRAVAAVAEADAKVLAALQAAPGLFVRPKSVVFHGLQVGYKKGTGTIEIDDAGQVVKLIRKHLPDQFDVLVKVKETPIKAAIRNLTGAELQKIGVKVQSAGEVVFLTDATDSVDKLVKALLKGVESEQDEDAEVEA